MNCEEFELVVRDLARCEVGDRIVVQLPGGSEHEQAVTEVGIYARVDAGIHAEGAWIHADECEACALRLQDERALSRRLDVLATEMMLLAPPARIEAKLLQAFRRTIAPSVLSQEMAAQLAVARAGSRKSYWLAAAAAVVLVVFGIALVRAKLLPTKLSAQPGADIRQAIEAGEARKATEARDVRDAKAPAPDSRPVPDAVTSDPNNSESVSAKALPGQENQELVVRRIRSKQRLITQPASRDSGDSSDDHGDGGDDREASLAALSAVTPPVTEDQPESEVATQFISLSYVAPASLQDGGQIVRVELPRSAMASFGLPVNMDRFGERVKADVLVSADGFARAIRFVQ
jgi:hypothetical protein